MHIQFCFIINVDMKALAALQRCGHNVGDRVQRTAAADILVHPTGALAHHSNGAVVAFADAREHELDELCPRSDCLSGLQAAAARRAVSAATQASAAHLMLRAIEKDALLGHCVGENSKVARLEAPRPARDLLDAKAP